MAARAPRLLARELGPATIVLLVAAYALLWLLARPAGEDGGSYLGQALGAEAVLLFTIALVLISTLPWVEAWFDGIDRAAIWHRRVAITGLALLVPHLALAHGEPGHGGPGGGLGAIAIIGLGALVAWAILPRWQSVVPRPLRPLVVAARDAPGIREVRRLFGGYERWRGFHRLIGLFVAAGVVHAALDGTPFDEAPVLRWTFLAVGGVGIAFYVYRELFARFFASLHDYQVAAVHPVMADLTEIVLEPLGRPVAFEAGQFAMVFIEGKDGWHRHPFTIASAPHEAVVRVTIKGLGDYTRRLRQLIEPGMPAVIGGPHGRFFHHRGGGRQVWIAGGVGIAPFLSWIRALDGTSEREIDFFYSAAGDMAFADELRAASERHARLRVHLVDTTVRGRLTPEQVLETVGIPPAELSVFMCGPAPMLRTFQDGLRRAGVPGRRIHREYFDWR